MNLLSFDLNLLRVLDALLETQSTTAAADRVGLSQPAVSAALKRLRHSLDDPLFVREGQRLVPTNFAQTLALPLRQTLDQLQSLLSGAESFDPARANRTFRIAGTDFVGEMLMPAIAKKTLKEAPGIRLILVDQTYASTAELLSEGSVDVATVPVTPAPQPPWAESVPLSDQPSVMIARRGHPRLKRANVNPGDVVPMNLFCDLAHALMSPNGQLEGILDKMLREKGHSRRVVTSAPYFSSVCRITSESDLVAVVPATMARKLADQMRLDIYECPIPPTVRLKLIWHSKHSHDAGHRWLREQLLVGSQE